MNLKQKQEVAKYRRLGLGYANIAKKLDMSVGTIRTYCRRNNLTGMVGYKPEGFCKNCGKELHDKPGCKPRRFCSDACKNKWWYLHKDLVKKKAYYDFICPVCHKAFTAYGNANRIYCSRKCYILDRFGGKQND